MANERKQKEQEILAQMNEGLQEEKKPEVEPKKKEGMQVHCHKCGTLMENGKCPACGHTMYVPMDEKKQRTIRWIAGGILFAVLIVILIIKG
jgi:rubrerythrin